MRYAYKNEFQNAYNYYRSLSWSAWWRLGPWSPSSLCWGTRYFSRRRSWYKSTFGRHSIHYSSKVSIIAMRPFWKIWTLSCRTSDSDCILTQDDWLCGSLRSGQTSDLDCPPVGRLHCGSRQSWWPFVAVQISVPWRWSGDPCRTCASTMGRCYPILLQSLCQACRCWRMA